MYMYPFLPHNEKGKKAVHVVPGYYHKGKTVKPTLPTVQNREQMLVKKKEKETNANR